jgi:hypothetical protein
MLSAMRRLLVGVVLFSAAGLLARPASAKDLTDRVGVGYSATFSGSPDALSSVSARYWVSQEIGVEGDLGLLINSPKGGSSSTNFGIGATGLYSFIDEPNLKLFGEGGLAFGSVGVTTVSATGVASTTGETAVGLNAGMGIEFFLVGLPNLGWTTELGLNYTTVSKVGSALSLGGGDFATFGIRYYFGGPKGPPPH